MARFDTQWHVLARQGMPWHVLARHSTSMARHGTLMALQDTPWHVKARHWHAGTPFSKLSSRDSRISWLVGFTLETAVITINEFGETIQSVNFLDVKAILHSNNEVSPDIFYKSTNSHDYLHYDSFHPAHTLHNIPYTLAKRMIVFVSDNKLVNKRSYDLRLWLKRCGYPRQIIDKAFHNAIDPPLKSLFQVTLFLSFQHTLAT